MNCSIKSFSKTRQTVWCEEVEDYKWFSIEPAIFRCAEKSVDFHSYFRYNNTTNKTSGGIFYAKERNYNWSIRTSSV